MNKYTIIFLVIILILVILWLFYYKSVESFSNRDDNYLYPIKGLTGICEKENLLPSYMPKACYVDGKMNTYANCKCEDKEGNCKICYDTIKKDSKNSDIIYNSE